LAIEPERLPLLVVHWLAGRHLEALAGVSPKTRDLICREVPHLVTPLQDRISRLCGLLQDAGEFVSSHRIERAINQYQRVVGDQYWMALEETEPTWLEDRYDALHKDLALD
jgi:hypothetical protein